MLALPAPETFGPFSTVRTGNDVTLDFQDACGEVVSNHYAFLVSETEFDAIFQRLRERDAAYWADPHHERPGTINTRDGGRGLYFEDPDGHNLEILNWAHVAHRRADLAHCARVLVPDDVRQRHTALVGPLSFDDVQIRAAHPGRVYLDEHVERPAHHRIGDRFDHGLLSVGVHAHRSHGDLR